MDFELIKSEKLRSNCAQEFMVVRKKVVYLRSVGDGKIYCVMTATAGEEGYRICQDKERLLKAAAQLARAYNCPEVEDNDLSGHKYIIPFNVSQDEGKSDADFTEEFKGYIREFFAIYDNC